jgi:tetratricopeptide (TPR) repeat protein
MLQNPLYLHLFMEAFHDRRAEAVAAAPALFRHYVERSLQPRPGLRHAVETVVEHMLQDLNRPSADLSDDDCNAIRRAWAEGLSVHEARLSLSPVESLVHEGLLSKRVREEGGGYRFVFQTVVEYLIYSQLTRSSSREGELVYWKQRAEPAQVFPEYAGAFGFLLRDWVAAGKLEHAAGLMEASPHWLGKVLTVVLVELGRRPTNLSGRASPAIEAAAHALSKRGAEECARALQEAGWQLMETRFAPAATAFFRSSVDIHERLWAANLDHLGIGLALGGALNNLGVLLRATGQTAEAERAQRRAEEIYEALYAACPDSVGVRHGLARTLNNLGTLLGASGRGRGAVQVHRRAVEIYEDLWAACPEDIDIGCGLGIALTNLGAQRNAGGQVKGAERVYLRAVEIYEALWAGCPANVKVGCGLGVALMNLGNLLSRDEDQAWTAQRTYLRAVDIYEALSATFPDNLTVPGGLAAVLNRLGTLLREADYLEEAQRTYARAVKIYEGLWTACPGNAQIAGDLALALENLGHLLRDLHGTRIMPRAFRLALEIRRDLYQANPNNLQIKACYAGSLYLLRRWDEAERLVDELLERLPSDPYANRLKRDLNWQRRRQGFIRRSIRAVERALKRLFTRRCPDKGGG